MEALAQIRPKWESAGRWPCDPLPFSLKSEQPPEPSQWQAQQPSPCSATTPPKPAKNDSIIIEYLVTDVDAEFARLEDSLEDIGLEPTAMPWGNRSTLFRDPDGNLVNLFSRPHPERAGTLVTSSASSERSPPDASDCPRTLATRSSSSPSTKPTSSRASNSPSTVARPRPTPRTATRHSARSVAPAFAEKPADSSSLHVPGTQ